jgi:hypothetical protein
MDADAIFAAVQSHALASGLFERVNAHEPMNPPGNGLSAAIWVQKIGPVGAASGLNSTTGRLAIYVRVYSSIQQQPFDAIDPNLLSAVTTLMGAYSGDFELGGEVRDVDLMGEHGQPLEADAGYVDQNGVISRVMTIVLPLIINDLWQQVA